MSNITVYYYDSENENTYSGQGETYEMVPGATTLVPALREPSDTESYEYRFDEEAGQWQEIAIPINEEADTETDGEEV